MFLGLTRDFLIKLFGSVLGFMIFIAFSAQKSCDTWLWELCGGIKYDPKAIVGYTILVLNIVLFLFNYSLWHTKIGRLLGWKTPDIRGTWSGELKLHRHLPGVHNPGVPIPIFMVVRQEAFSVRISLYTRESVSSSLASEFTKIDDDNELIYSYRNQPELQYQTRSQIHIGTAVLNMMSIKPSLLKGQYYTDRLTLGTMELTLHSPKLAISFQDGLAMQFQQRPILR